MEYKPNSSKNNTMIRVFEIVLFLIALIILVLYLSSLRERVESPTPRVAVEEDTFDPFYVTEETLETVVVAEPVPESVPVSTVSASKFIIQIASFSQKDKAEALVNKLKSEGYISDIQQRDLGDKGMWYRVYVGGFQTEQEAKNILEVLKKQYKDSFVRAF